MHAGNCEFAFYNRTRNASALFPSTFHLLDAITIDLGFGFGFGFNS